ncbi:DegV family protein [Cellulomonas edaphi]|uniref:DegV family protein n=1 Tax=Cellulomonas edaphi TaxID=3053468 RepID=A0ABT7S7H3_9CELL|nr:DegV family protein [Cellulomons edaphi]MDM7831569.1 DegV family protein [Cellulomons edaphi]
MTDSTASLPDGAAERWGIGVVPLDVVIDGERLAEGVDLSSSDLLAALERGARVSTSQPSPAAFAAAYRRAADSGARDVVSIHLSGELSGTVQAARLAAESAPLPVHVVDSRAVGMALGFAVLDAARLAAGLAPAPASLLRPAPSAPTPAPRWYRRRPEPAALPPGEAVGRHAAGLAGGAGVWFLVDSLEHLRRGGRLSAPAAAIGTVLGLRPLLTLGEGQVVVAEKVRTRRAARDRLQAVALEDIGARGAARIAVHHLGQPDVAAAIAEQLTAWAGERLVEAVVCESSAVLAAHAGPGLLAVVVTDA